MSDADTTNLDSPPSPVTFDLEEVRLEQGDPPPKPSRSSVTEETDTPSEDHTVSDSADDTSTTGVPGRRESKVRFSDVDLPKLEELSKLAMNQSKTEDDKNSDSSGGSSPSISEMYRDYHGGSSGGGSRLNIRRSSIGAMHHVKEESASVQMSHPRRRVSAAFESLDYTTVESERFLREQQQLDAKTIKRQSNMRWLVNFAVGVYVAIIAVIVWLLIKYISKGKFMALYKIVEKCDTFGCTIPGVVVWILFNIFFTFIGAYLVTFHAPSAAGSGIPQVKCYLNGIKMPGLMSVRTLLAKAGGVVLSVCGGLACGKEGPMIHSGAICASGLASGRFHCCKQSCAPNCCDGLRSDEERRDFVAAGAASGVSAAFASPVGGVLFALEEGASFVKQELTWRMLFSSMIAGLFLNFLMSCINGHPEDMSMPGLISFGYLGDIEFRTFEIPIFMIMGLIGGLLGALFVAINYKITIFRRKKVKKPWLKVGEACLVAAASAIILYLLIYAVPDCHPIEGFATETPTPLDKSGPVVDDLNPPTDSVLAGVTSGKDKGDSAPGGEHSVHKRSAAGGQSVVADNGNHDNTSADHGNPYGDHGHGIVFQGLCPYGQHNRMADILFGTPEQGLHSMLHAPLDKWTMAPLFTMVIFYHLLTTWTYGLNVSSGLFIPSLLIGAVWGRIIGMVVMQFIPAAGTNIAKYVLVGAAAQLGGFVRMTISLTVIVIECTGDITFGIPMILTLIMAKWMGDFFNPGIYDLHIEIWGAPLLGWAPPNMCYNVPAKEVMSTPVNCLRMVETVDRIRDIIEDEDSHNGYPVVDDYDPTDLLNDTFGRLKGFIMKSQLKELLKEHEEEGTGDGKIQLKEHMSVAPYSVQEDVPLPRIFVLFRSIGLRHLIVVNDRNRVVGMITRINLARFRGEMVKGKFHIEELEVVEE